jgi:hypothetical protein
MVGGGWARRPRSERRQTTVAAAVAAVIEINERATQQAPTHARTHARTFANVPGRLVQHLVHGAVRKHAPAPTTLGLPPTSLPASWVVAMHPFAPSRHTHASRRYDRRRRIH